MALAKHPRSAEFLKWCSQLRNKRVAVEGEYFRVAGPRHTTAEAIVSGIGARKAGGRWNPPGEMLVVYLSRTPETALCESLAHFRYYGLPDSQGLPKVVVSLAVRLNRVLDLTDDRLRGTLPEAVDDMLAEDWRALNEKSAESASQALSRAAFAARFQGLLVPSKADPAGTNLLAFPENFTKKCRLEVQNADVLDKLGRRT